MTGNVPFWKVSKHITINNNNSNNNNNNNNNKADPSAGIAVSNPAWEWKLVSSKCCVLSGRGLCAGPIPRPEESYRVYVCVCMSFSVIRCNSKPPQLQWVGRDQTEEEIIIIIIHNRWSFDSHQKCRIFLFSKTSISALGPSAPSPPLSLMLLEAILRPAMWRREVGMKWDERTAGTGACFHACFV
jgi:hypothetical protein